MQCVMASSAVSLHRKHNQHSSFAQCAEFSGGFARFLSLFDRHLIRAYCQPSVDRHVFLPIGSLAKFSLVWT